MQISFHGAARTVTGSRHLLTINGARILLDCGLYQGRRKDAFQRNRTFQFDPAAVDAVILSHAHIDHSGNLPSLVRQGFQGPIHATRPTVGLCQYMLADSAHIQESDAEYVNRRRSRKGKPLVEPLYTKADAEATMPLFVGQRYERPFEVAPGVAATFYHAGHILGAAVTVLDIDEDGRRRRLVFSGDLGREDVPLLHDPHVPGDVDLLIMESTYGDRTTAPPDDARDKLREIMTECCRRRSKVIIPAFAVGRSQRLIYDLHQMMDAGEIERVPIYLDSPLAVNVTRVFRRSAALFDEEAHELVRRGRHEGVFDFPEAHYVGSVEESKALNQTEGPMVIISASGMAEAGRILHHLKNNIGDPDSIVLIVGWQAPHTLGRRLVEGKRTVKIFGDEYRLRARVETINGFSAHADRDGLLRWVDALASDLEGVYLVHGDPEAAFALQEGLEAQGIRNVNVPEHDETVTL